MGFSEGFFVFLDTVQGGRVDPREQASRRKMDGRKSKAERVSHVRSQHGHGWARSRKEPPSGGRALGVKMSQGSLESERSQVTCFAR